VTARGKEAAALALHRFGVGPGRDSIAAIAGDPRGPSLSDINRPVLGIWRRRCPRAVKPSGGFRLPRRRTAKMKVAQRAQKLAEACPMARMIVHQLPHAEGGRVSFRISTSQAIPTGPPPASAGTVQLLASGKCLDLPGGQAGDCTPAIQYD
jgi:hypothetical protein